MHWGENPRALPQCCGDAAVSGTVSALFSPWICVGFVRKIAETAPTGIVTEEGGIGSRFHWTRSRPAKMDRTLRRHAVEQLNQCCRSVARTSQKTFGLRWKSPNLPAVANQY